MDSDYSVLVCYFKTHGYQTKQFRKYCEKQWYPVLKRGGRVFILVSLLRMTVQNVRQGQVKLFATLQKTLPQKVLDVIPQHPTFIPKSHARFAVGDLYQQQIVYDLQLMHSYCGCNPINKALFYILLSRDELEHDSFTAINKSVEAVFEIQLCPSRSFLFMHLMDLAMLTQVCNTHAAHNLFLGSRAHKIFITHACAPQQHSFFCYILWEQLEHAVPKSLHMLSWWEG